MSDNGFFTGAPGEGRYPMCLELHRNNSKYSC